jgi:hypothetical protein
MNALEAAGGLAYWLGDGPLSVNVYRERLSEAERRGTSADVADAQFDLSFGLANVGEVDAATRAWRTASSAYAELGDAIGVARCRWVESSFDLMAQRFAEARANLMEIIPVFREQGDYNFLALATGSLSVCEVVLGDLAAAERLFSEVVLMGRGRTGVVGVVIGLGPLAKLLTLLGRREDGARLTGAFDALSETYGVHMPAPLAQLLEVAEARMGNVAELDPAVRQPLIEAGRRMTVDQVLEFVGSSMALPSPPE